MAPTSRLKWSARLSTLSAWFLISTGCDRLIGLNDYRIASEAPLVAEKSCSVHADCAGSDSSYCLQPAGQCVALLSPDCQYVSGPADADNAILIGSMVAIAGQQAGVNRARLRSMQMAVEELNTLGGVPANVDSAKPRPLVLVSCDESMDAERAAKHLTHDLHVAAIIGPTDSQNSLDLTARVIVPADTLSISPTAIADGLAGLRDKNLSWLISPTDAQRGRLLINELQLLERALRTQRGRDLKLGIVFEEGALGAGTRSALVDLKWNGESLSMASNLGTNVKLSGYDPKQAAQTELVASYAAFAADVMVLVGGNEIVRDVMAQLEAAWGNSAARPEYVFVDAAKGPDLLQLVANDPTLQRRVRGTGVSPSPDSEPVFRSFLVDYEAHYPDDMQAAKVGVSPNYDAVYALAYAMVAGRGIKSADIARGLPLLYTPGAAVMPVGPFTVVSAFQQLVAAQPIALQGTLSALTWDARGAIAAGTLEIWCVDNSNGTAYASSGLTADLTTNALLGENHLCAAQGEKIEPSTTATTATMPTVLTPDAGIADAGTQPTPDAGTSATAMMPNQSGDAGGPSVSGATRNPSNARDIPCGTLNCRASAGEACCIEAILGENGAPASRFRCTAGATGPATCAANLQCSSDKECGAGEICCMDAQRNARCSAASSCSSPQLHLACNRPDDCASGEVCCGQGDARGPRATSCAARCDSGSAALICSMQNQCPAGTSCRQNWALPSLGMCAPTEMMP